MMNETFVERRNIAVNLDDEYVVISACAVSCEDIVRLARFLGVIKEEGKKDENRA